MPSYINRHVFHPRRVVRLVIALVMAVVREVTAVDAVDPAG